MHINLVSADAATGAGAIDTIKSGANDIVNWLGRGVSLAKDTIVALVSKIISSVGPVFESITQFVKESFANIKDYIDANSDIAVPVGIASVVALFAGVAGYVLLCGEKSDGQTTATSTR